MPDTTEKLIRPVKCHFCNKPMFYKGDERHEPEVFVTVHNIFCTSEEGGGPESFYAHVKCWNEMTNHNHEPKP